MAQLLIKGTKVAEVVGDTTSLIANTLYHPNGTQIITDDGGTVGLTNVNLHSINFDNVANDSISGDKIHGGTISDIFLDGIKLNSSGNSIFASDGITPVLSESGGVVSINGTFNGTIGTTASLPAGTVVQTEYQYVNYDGVPTAGGTNVGSSVTVLYPCTKILCQTVVTARSPIVYANYGAYNIGISTDASISVSTTSVVGPNDSFVGADLAQDGEQVYGTVTSSKLFIRNSGSPPYYNTGDTVQPGINVGPVYGGAYFYGMGIHIYFIK